MTSLALPCYLVHAVTVTCYPYSCSNHDGMFPLSMQLWEAEQRQKQEEARQEALKQQYLKEQERYQSKCVFLTAVGNVIIGKNIILWALLFWLILLVVCFCHRGLLIIFYKTIEFMRSFSAVLPYPLLLLSSNSALFKL